MWYISKDKPVFGRDLFAGTGVVEEDPVSVTVQELHHVLGDDPAPVFSGLWDPPRLSPHRPPVHGGQLLERDVGKHQVVPLPVVHALALELPEVARDLGGDSAHAVIPCHGKREITRAVWN